MRALLLGPARHGKDTVAEMMVRQAPYLKFASSSLFCAKRFIFDALKGQYGYESVRDCYNDRSNHRAEWFTLIQTFNARDPTRLAREVLKENDIYVGMRDWREVDACLKAELFNVILWVDASERLPPEPKTSMNFSLDDLLRAPSRKCPLQVMDNNGTRPIEAMAYE